MIAYIYRLSVNMLCWNRLSRLLALCFTKSSDWKTWIIKGTNETPSWDSITVVTFLIGFSSDSSRPSATNQSFFDCRAGALLYFCHLPIGEQMCESDTTSKDDVWILPDCSYLWGLCSGSIWTRCKHCIYYFL